MASQFKSYCNANTCTGCNSIHTIREDRYCYDDKFLLPSLDVRERHYAAGKKVSVINNAIDADSYNNNPSLAVNIDDKDYPMPQEYPDKCLYCLNEVYNILSTHKKTFRIRKKTFMDAFINTAKELLEL
jgi:hypothetical protein